jgi:hypothetical protein
MRPFGASQPNAAPLKHMRALLGQLQALGRAVNRQPLLDNDFGCRAGICRLWPRTQISQTSFKSRTTHECDC